MDPSSDCPVEFDRKEILTFAKDHWKNGHRWNGRQIKNSFQTALALAEWDHLKFNKDAFETPLLERTHFEKVAEASAHFDYYLKQVRSSDEARAKALEIRADEADVREMHTSSSRVKTLEMARATASRY